MKPKLLKVVNNKGKQIKVTQFAWDTLYKDRKGFSLYVEDKKKSESKTDTKSQNTKKPKTTAKTTAKKAPAKKKVAKNDSTK